MTRCRQQLKRYTDKDIGILLMRAKLCGLSLEEGSPLEKLTLQEVDALLPRLILKSYEITIRCQAQPQKHAKVIRFQDTDKNYVDTLAALLDGTSHLYIYKPGEFSPIGKCATCGGALRSEVKEIDATPLG